MSIESYLIPETNVLIEEEIKHSRFVSLLFHCPNPEHMKQVLTNVKLDYPGESHYCYAFVAGPPGDYINIGSSDDGEPSGSAGKPMLACLQGAHIGELGAIVVRHYGGTKLGVGGLVRAYTSGIKQGLTQLTTLTKFIRYPIQIRCDYGQLNHLEYLIGKYDGVVLEKQFEQDIMITFELARNALAHFNVELAVLTQGQLQIKFTV